MNSCSIHFLSSVNHCHFRDPFVKFRIKVLNNTRFAVVYFPIKSILKPFKISIKAKFCIK